jgi:hypothetical protein
MLEPPTIPPATPRSETVPADPPPADPPTATPPAATAPAEPPPAEPPPPDPPPSTRVETAPPAHVSTKSLTILSWLVIAAGVVLVAAGGATWFVVRDQLANEKITVSDDADHFAGDAVDGPLTAFSQADTINHHALEASGGKTYAELAKDDPVRQTVMTASFLRASLFTSVVSFGVAAFAAGIGVLMLIIGFALRKVSRLLSTQLVPAVDSGRVSR